MKPSNNPFTNAILRLGHETFGELIMAASKSEGVDQGLIKTALRVWKSQERALRDCGVLTDEEDEG